MVDESESMGLLAEIYEAAIDLFDGDRDAAERWLASPPKGLGHVCPVDVVRRQHGARAVREMIGRLNDGIFT